MKLFSKILLVCACLILCNGLGNPGSLVSVPLADFKPPRVNINLPITIPPILINELQLSQIYLQTVVYDWVFTEEYAKINISNAVVLFHWRYKADSGFGSFTQTQYQLQLNYKFLSNSKSRIQIDIISSKSKLGHSAVHLGGNVPQTVAVEVTDLILNHAAITFRKTIENTIANAITSFSSILETDLKIICSSQSKSKCVYINTTLVAPPIVSNRTLLIQINGAPYITNETSGILNPDKVLTKTNSSQVELQVHQKLFDQTLKKIVNVLPQHFDFWIDQISSTPDINSLTISPAFPKMLNFEAIRNVLFQVQQPNLALSFDRTNQLIELNGSATLDIFTTDEKTKELQKYMNPCSLDFSLSLSIVYGWKSTSLRIKKLQLGTLKCDEKDIAQDYVHPYQYSDIATALSVYLRTGINGSLNRKLITLDFNGIQAVLRGSFMDQVMKFDIDLTQSDQKNQIKSQ